MPLIENVCMVKMGEREMRKAATNSGLPIDLPPGTSRVIFHLIPESPEPLPTPIPVSETKAEKSSDEKTEA